MKRYALFLTILTLLTGACSSEHEAQEEAVPTVTDTLPNLVMQIQKTSRLYTTEYHIHKIVTHDDVVRLKGNLLQKDFDIRLCCPTRR